MDNAPIDSARLNRLGNRLLLAAAVTLISGVSSGLLWRLGARQSFQPPFIIFQVLSVVLFFIGFSLKGARARLDALRNPLQSPTDPYRHAWIMMFILAGLVLLIAITDWSSTDPSSPRTPWYVFAFPAFFIAQILVNRYAFRLTWLQAMAQEQEFLSRDEREEHILRRASQLGFSMGFLLTLILLVILVAAPWPSKYTLANLFFALVFLQLGLRSFFVWLLGLR